MQFVVEQRGFECLSLEVYKKKKTHFKRGGWDSCWVWVSVSMSFRRHGWVLDKSHVIPSAEQLKEFYFHHLEFWSWQCAELRIKCQFSEKSPEMCHAKSCGPAPVPSRLPDMMLWRLFAWHLISARLSFGYLANRGDITGPGLFSVTILSPRQRDWSDPSPHPHNP